jgi:phosphatidylserine decarboxylase
MTIHREGYVTIALATVFCAGVETGAYYLYQFNGWTWLLAFLSLANLVFYYLIVQFFRIPSRKYSFEPNDILCPADGKVVVIEEVEETEFIKGRCRQISVFMSPLNVHANYFPISGEVKYMQYHPGLFLVAWHPKSSTDNERTTLVVEHSSGQHVLVRQVAGALARRICYYAKAGQKATSGEEFGFIKFGSRVDIYVPLDAQINVKLGDVVQAKITKLGELTQKA